MLNTGVVKDTFPCFGLKQLRAHWRQVLERLACSIYPLWQSGGLRLSLTDRGIKGLTRVEAEDGAAISERKTGELLGEDGDGS